MGVYLEGVHMSLIALILQIISVLPTAIVVIKDIIGLIQQIPSTEQAPACTQLRGILKKHAKAEPDAIACHKDLLQLHYDLKGKYGL